LERETVPSTGDDQEDKSIVKDASRLLRKLRRKVYREVPIATWNRAAEVDWRGSYGSLIATFRRGDCGVLSGGAALALWRAATDAGFRAWCYDFGFPESLTHMVTVVELDGRFRVHDPLLNLEYRADFYEIIEGLRADRLPDIRRETRDRKIYVVDLSCESQLTVDWLTAHSDRELDRVGSLRRFEVLWDSDAMFATLARPEAVYRDLETRGYPAELSYLMLHPIGVFDGRAHHQNLETMPLVGGRDLRSPVAGLRAAMQQLTRDLAVERDQLAEKSAISGRLESELAESQSQLLAASGEAEQLSAQSAQLRAAIDDSSRQWIAERQVLSQGNAALEERRAVLEAELAEATAHRAAAEEEARRLADQVVQLRSAYDDAEGRIAAEREVFLQRQQKLEAALGEANADAAAVGERRAVLEAELAEVTAHHAAAADEARRLADQVVQLRSAYDDAERRIAAERELFLQQQQELEAALGETSAHAAAMEAQAQGLEQTIRTLQDATDQRTAEWEAERLALQTAAQGLTADKQQLQTEVAHTRADLITAHGQIAELRDTLGHRTAEWDGERRSLQEAAQALVADKHQLQAEVADTRADLITAHGKITEMRDTLNRRTAEWDDERQSLQASVQALDEETRYAFAASGAAQLRAEKAEAQATWADFHIAELVEKEAAAASAVFGIKRLIGADDLPSDDLPVVFARLREHVRKLERELDRAEAERDRLNAERRQPAPRRASPAVRVGSYLRGLFYRGADHGGKLFLMKG
jgi:predicted  nucleic acid-binding Zn-ribbon protein